MPFLLAVTYISIHSRKSKATRLTIKDLSVLQLANIAHLDTIALLGGLALALLLVIDSNTAHIARALGSLLLGLCLGCFHLW